jgi:uncharacterized membrane protein
MLTLDYFHYIVIMCDNFTLPSWVNRGLMISMCSECIYTMVINVMTITESHMQILKWSVSAVIYLISHTTCKCTQIIGPFSFRNIKDMPLLEEYQ